MKITENCFNGEQFLFVLAASLIVFNPYNKSGLSVVQGLYGEFAKIFAFVGTILCIASYCKITSTFWYEDLGIWVIVFFVAFVVTWNVFWVIMFFKYKKN